MTNIVYRNCNDNWQFCRTRPCLATSPWQLLSHSDQFLPNVMQLTRNVTYQNANLNNLVQLTTNKTLGNGITGSGRLQNWIDADCSVFPNIAKGNNGCLIGSNWSGDWWKLRDNCVTAGELWVCPRTLDDSTASFLMRYDIEGSELDIGVNYCANGVETISCPIIGSVTPFGEVEGGPSSLQLSMLARVTGPTTQENGGWFIRYNQGTPKNLIFTEVQVPISTNCLLAIPYPLETSISVKMDAFPGFSGFPGIYY